MSNFKDSPHFKIHDDYYTPKSAWVNIQDFIKVRGYKTIFEPFMLNSNEQSKVYLEELGFNVIGNKNIDFLDKTTWTEDMKNKKYDIIVSNPPFQKIISYPRRTESLKYNCIEQLIKNDKPFIILLNSTNIFSKWFQYLVKDINQHIKFIYPTQKINYDKYEKGGVDKIKLEKNNASFNSVYVCYKVLDNNEWL